MLLCFSLQKQHKFFTATSDAVVGGKNRGLFLLMDPQTRVCTPGKNMAQNFPWGTTATKFAMATK
jgi:hypothetical protein